MNSSFFSFCFCLFFVFLWKSLLLPTDGMGWTKLFQRSTHLKPQLLVDSLVKKYGSITEEKSQGELPVGTDEAHQICPKWQMASCIPALIHLFSLDFAPIPCSLESQVVRRRRLILWIIFSIPRSKTVVLLLLSGRQILWAMSLLLSSTEGSRGFEGLYS